MCGAGLPKYILDLPSDLLDTPLGPEILAELDCISSTTQKQGSSGIILSSFTGSSSNTVIFPRVNREESPELQELQAQIEALRADQLSLEERRNAINLKDSKKEKKKKKKDKEERKERKLRKGVSLGESEDSSGCSTPLPHPCLLKSASLDPAPTYDLRTLEKEDNTSSSLSPPQSILKDRTLPTSGEQPVYQNTSSDEQSSILSVSENSKANQLVRNKSLKRVSFDEKPDIIEDGQSISIVAAVTNIQEEQEPVDLETDLPPLEVIPESVGRSSSRVNRRSPTPPSRMAEQEQIEIPPEAEGGEVVMPKKEKKPHEKGITFREFDHVKDFEDLVRTVVTLCDGDEQERLREMEDWIVKNEGTWVLAEGFNTFLGNVFHKDGWPSDGRVAMLRLLAYGAEQDDIVLILHMDRKDHLLMNYAQQFDRLPIKEQETLAMLFCNLFETASASEWLLYISEWDAPGGGLPLSNIRVTTKVAVNALLGDTPTLVDHGSALMANLATKEVKAVVFDDVCSELAMAILQFFQGKPPEEQVFRCMKALGKFCSIASREVPQLVKMIGPEPSKFSGMSPRVDELIAPISARLAAVPMF